MSSREGGGDHMGNANYKQMERAVTDSVHERFRPPFVRCDVCNVDFMGNRASIRKHFDDSHFSDKQCCYCKGKVFVYREIFKHDSGAERSQEHVFHRCPSAQR